MIATFIGHRRIQNRSGISKRIREIVLYLIEYRNVDTFLFGSRSDFDELCLEAVSEIKTIKPHINRIYVRAAYPHIDEIYLEYLYRFYDSTYIPDGIDRAGKSAYVERNFHMIDKADICVFYFDKGYIPPIADEMKNRFYCGRRKSGTQTAYEYALKCGKPIINLYAL